MRDFRELLNAGDAGTAWAKDLRAGDRFNGARPEAQARYGVDTQAQNFFVDRALDVLEAGTVWTDGNGVLTRDVIVGPKLPRVD